MASEAGQRAARRPGVPNGSEPIVPNRSELFRTHSEATASKAANDASAGRPPLLDDAALDELAQTLTRQFGRPPRIHELTDAAGGCQRQRASRAIQRLRLGIAEKAVRSQITLPQALESDLRSWVGRWLQSAAQQLREIHADLAQRHEEALLDAQDLLSEQSGQLKDLSERLADQARMTSELLAANKGLQAELDQVRAERDIANAVADELRRVIEGLNRGDIASGE